MPGRTRNGNLPVPAEATWSDTQNSCPRAQRFYESCTSSGTQYLGVQICRYLYVSLWICTHRVSFEKKGKTGKCSTWKSKGSQDTHIWTANTGKIGSPTQVQQVLQVLSERWLFPAQDFHWIRMTSSTPQGKTKSAPEPSCHIALYLRST